MSGSSIGTFGSFTQARLAIYASQAGLTVTGNNISNINTNGYTRQNLDQTSFYAGGADRYYSTYGLRIGNGVLATGVSQLRDPYLDIRYRSASANVGYMDAKLGGLETIQSIIDEVGDGVNGNGVISAQLSDLLDQLEQIDDQTGQAEYDIQVSSSADSLCQLLRSYAAQLQEAYDNAEIALEEDVAEVNDILTSIRELNVEIRKAEIHGDKALELRDERNVLIDELSTFMKIDVIYTEEDLGGGLIVEKLTISLADANPDPNVKVNSDTSVLVNGVYATQLSLGDKTDKYAITLGPLTDVKGRVLKGPTTTTTTTADAVPVVDANGNAILDGAGNPTYAPDVDGALTDNNDGTYTLVTTDTRDGYLYTATTTYTPVYGNDADPTEVTSYDATTVTTSVSTEVVLLDNDLHGALQAQREMLTECGEFASADDIAEDPSAATKRGYLYYMYSLDLLANKIATVFNEANQGYVYNEDGYYITEPNENDEVSTILFAGEPLSREGLTATQQAYLNDLNNTEPRLVDEEGNYIEDENGNYILDTDAYLAANNGWFQGEILFSNNSNGDDTTNISASNISISATWSDSPSIVNTFKYVTNAGFGSTDSSNILHMIALMGEDMTYDPTVISPITGKNSANTNMFTGDFNEMYINMCSILGNDMKTTSSQLDTSYATAVDLNSSRESVSGVDLNDEAMNLMQYSKSYNAACRLMTTIDSVLDKLINGTGMTT